jgi:hypothetical protein
MPSPRPLPSLLARAVRDLTGTYVRAGAGSPGVPSVPLWFGLLRIVDLGGVPTKQVPALSRLSRRTIRPALRDTARAGWIDVSPTGVTLTAAGERTREAWLARVPEAEQAWATAVGPDRAEALRGATATVVARFDLELPHYPISYGAVDSSVTGGVAGSRPGQEGPPRIPPHGDDWRPVIRAEARADTVAGLPLMALLSQALLAYTIDCDAAGLGSLAVIEGLTAGFGARDSVPLAELPRALGVTGSGRTGLERHRYVTVVPDPDEPGRKLATLLPRGLRARDRRESLLTDVESAWSDRYGRNEVAALRAALTAIDTVLDPTLRGHLLVGL